MAKASIRQLMVGGSGNPVCRQQVRVLIKRDPNRGDPTSNPRDGSK